MKQHTPALESQQVKDPRGKMPFAHYQLHKHIKLATRDIGSGIMRHIPVLECQKVTDPRGKTPSADSLDQALFSIQLFLSQ